MTDDVLVRVENVSKRFCRSLKRSLWYGLQDLGSEIAGRRHGGGSGLPQSSADVQLRQDEFWAVKDVSFELRRGECLGLIGRNGAGKTTLLRMLNGLIKTDTGKISVYGQTGSLIALGAGFNPILTGRENVKIAGSILGLSESKIREKLDEIVDFAEISDFIDSPVQGYSSGMQVRLGFAVATALNPDVLILDEVLAVGDLQFRMKCYSQIDKMRKDTAVIFVSHSLEHIGRICTKGLLLSHGSQAYQGNVSEALSGYADSFNAKGSTSNKATYCDQDFFYDVNSEVLDAENLNTGDPLRIALKLTARTESFVHVRVGLFSLSTGEIVGTAESRLSCPGGLSLKESEVQVLHLSISSIPLRSGRYDLRLSIFNARDNTQVYSSSRHHDLEIQSSFFGEVPTMIPLFSEGAI
ncbi:ABC transporter ATP-binding protein [Synechococcus sp. RS9907]|uniref:ABC transporter ATP-binding protein n=1 Tax=Synechococcus sp. RS9907 TaxID=221350 RepID=UPI00165D5AB8|nr:ABC transporter ATP-binding protein [Synechococcus sp. RS9907]